MAQLARKDQKMEKQIRAIIFAEKQAEFHCIKGSQQWQGWINDAKNIRQKIGEDRQWWKLQSALRTD